jgi:hypothetical protein
LIDRAALERLIAALATLASSPEEQKQHLLRLGLVGSVDELALECDDAYRPLAQALQDRLPVAGAACSRVDGLLCDKDLGWTEEDLANAEWQRVRSSARDALSALEEHSEAR